MSASASPAHLVQVCRGIYPPPPPDFPEPIKEGKEGEKDEEVRSLLVELVLDWLV